MSEPVKVKATPKAKAKAKVQVERVPGYNHDTGEFIV